MKHKYNFLSLLLIIKYLLQNMSFNVYKMYNVRKKRQEKQFCLVNCNLRNYINIFLNDFAVIIFPFNVKNVLW